MTKTPQRPDLSILGQTVTLVIDRPLGSTHPRHDDIIYPVNYGYVPGIFAPDGEEQDAYLLGVTAPVKQFQGVVAAVVHRRDDVEDKWIVTPPGYEISDDEILSLTRFQEQWFDSVLYR